MWRIIKLVLWRYVVSVLGKVKSIGKNFELGNCLVFFRKWKEVIGFKYGRINREWNSMCLESCEGFFLNIDFSL